MLNTQLRIIFLALFFAFMSANSFSQSYTLEEELKQGLEQRYATVELPDTNTFYGQGEALEMIVNQAFCSAAKEKGLRLGTDGWLFNLKDGLDFGPSEAAEGIMPTDEVISWLRSYRIALESVGITPIMLLLPQRGLLSEDYLSAELKQELEDRQSLKNYQSMLEDYLEAGFVHTPDLYQLTTDTAKKGDYYAYYPIDHHITTHTALDWAKEVATIVMSQEGYEDFEKAAFELELLPDTFTVIGWHQQMEVQWACESNMEGQLFNPIYELSNPATANSLFSDIKPLIATVGSSHLGANMNRAGTSDYLTPGSGLSEFIAYLTQLPVQNHAMFSLANASIEHYLRNDFYAEAPPPYLVQLIEAHHHPYPIYHYRSMAPMTYGKCQNPVWQGELLFDDYFELTDMDIELSGNSMDYYLWMELDLPVLEHRKWSIDIDYDNNSESIIFDTDDRFLEFPSTFGIQLESGSKHLSRLQVNPDAKWYEGDIITTSLCYIPDVQNDYKQR